jgi:hypothetical protein
MNVAFAHKNRVVFVLNEARNSFSEFIQGDARDPAPLAPDSERNSDLNP